MDGFQKIQCVTLCTHANGWFDALQSSCAQNGLPLAVLGWGQTWKGIGWKFELMLEYLTTETDPDIVVCFVDAYDVIVLQPAAEIMRRFHQLIYGGGVSSNRPSNGGLVVFGVEDPLGRSHFIRFMESVRFSQCNKHVLNTGVYMGRSADVRDLFLKVQAAYPNEPDDQQRLGTGNDRGYIYHSLSGTGVSIGLKCTQGWMTMTCHTTERDHMPTKPPQHPMFGFQYQ